MSVSAVVGSGGTGTRGGKGKSRCRVGKRGGAIQGGSGAVIDSGPGLKAGRTTVVTYHNRGTDTCAPVTDVLGWNATTQQ